MARIARQLLKTPSVSYFHLISHIQDELPFFRPSEKEYLLRLLRKLSEVFTVKVISYAIMGNHFHLFVKAPGEDYLSEEESEEEAVKRSLSLFRPFTVFSHSASYWKEKLSDISQFMKELNQRFSQHYNRGKGRKGHVFRDRFRSIRVEDGRAALVVSLYIELNPVRAGISKSVDSYRWTGYAARRAGDENWLLSLEDELGLDLKGFGELIEGLGKMGVEGKGKLSKEQRALVAYILMYRAEGIVYGTMSFVRKVLEHFPFRRRIKKKARELVLA